MQPRAASKAFNDIAQVVVGEVRGAPVLVKDVAEVMLGKELRTGAATPQWP